MPSGEILWLLVPAFVSVLLLAGAVYSLVRLSVVLGSGFDKVSGRGHEPFVTASLEPSAAGRRYLDLVIDNSGFAPAFDVKVTTTPEIPADPDRGRRPEGWCDVSLLRPGQSMVMYACPASAVEATEFAVDVSWKHSPATRDRTVLGYRLDMRNYGLQEAYPAPPPPLDDLTSEVRRLRLAWRDVLRGDRSLQVELAGDALRELLVGELPDEEGGAHRGRGNPREERNAKHRKTRDAQEPDGDARERRREAVRLGDPGDGDGASRDARAPLSEAGPGR
jgi:hypothetical protein